MARQKKEKKVKAKNKNKSKSMLYYLNPKHTFNEVLSYGYEVNMTKTIIAFIAFLVATLVACLGFRVSLPVAIIMFAVDFLIFPKLLVNTYKKMYESRRFHDVSDYVEQFLYSFGKNRAISLTLMDIRVDFGDKPLAKTIDRAIEAMTTAGADEDAKKKALDIIEEEYPCDKVRNAHKFALQAEDIGGDFSSSINILQADRKNWEIRNSKELVRRNKLKTDVTISIIFSIILCLVFLLILVFTARGNETLNGLDISDNIVVQGATAALWLISCLTYVYIDNKTCVNIIEKDKKYTEEKQLYLKNKVEHWDNAKEVKKSIKYFIIGTIFALIVAGITFGLSFLGIIDLYSTPENVFETVTLSTTIKIGIGIACVIEFISFLMLFQHILDKKLSYKAVVNEIIKEFPNWLMNIALLLQTSNVGSAIYESIEDCPAILRSDVEKLYEDILEQPDSPEPFNDFLKMYDIRAINSSVRVLYALKEGSTYSPDEQISEILQKNNEILSVSEEIELKEIVSKLKITMGIPLITGSLKLGTDMVIFFGYVMTNMNV